MWCTGCRRRSRYLSDTHLAFYCTSSEFTLTYGYTSPERSLPRGIHHERLLQVVITYQLWQCSLAQMTACTASKTSLRGRRPRAGSRLWRRHGSADVRSHRGRVCRLLEWGLPLERRGQELGRPRGATRRSVLARRRERGLVDSRDGGRRAVCGDERSLHLPLGRRRRDMERTQGIQRTTLERHWESPIDPHYARLRALEAVPGRPDRLIAGVEAGGIHLSNDGGQTWLDRRDTIIDDIHQILPISLTSGWPQRAISITTSRISALDTPSARAAVPDDRRG